VIGFGELLQVSGNSPFQWLIPVAYFAVALIGVVWALVMRSVRPEAYAAIGRGTEGRVSNVTIDSLLAKGSHEPVGARAFHY